MLLELIYETLDMDEAEGPRQLIGKAAGIQPALPFVILSLLDQQAVTFGEASRAELARARTREDHLARLARELTAMLDLKVMKGPSIAGWYPPGVLRGHGDLDLVAADEATLWHTVHWATRREPVDRIDVSLIGGAPSHLVVTLDWPSTDPLVDPSYGIDLSTAAFVGDGGAVPLRADLPADAVVAALLAIAEERFQRAFRPRDVLDVAMLDAAPLPPLPEVLDTVADYCRAPELAELLRYASLYRPLDRLGPLLAALPHVVDRELARRAAVPARPDTTDVAERMATGQVVYGYPIRPGDWRDPPAASVVEFSHGHLLRTPVGDYLLTGGATVSRAGYEAALAHCGVGRD